MRPDHPCLNCGRYGWAWVRAHETHPGCGWYCTACGCPAPACCLECVKPVYDFGIWAALVSAGVYVEQPRL